MSDITRTTLPVVREGLGRRMSECVSEWVNESVSQSFVQSFSQSVSQSVSSCETTLLVSSVVGHNNEYTFMA